MEKLIEHETYRSARADVWISLGRNQIKSLPVNIKGICRAEGIGAIPYSKAYELIQEYGLNESTKNNDGFSTTINGRKLIFFNDNCSPAQQGEIISHEYGHHLSMIKNPDKDTLNLMEYAARTIAVRLLAPACVLWGVGVRTPQEIANLCQISIETAESRMERMEELYEREHRFKKEMGRSCFLLSYLEMQVFERSRKFIDEAKLHHPRCYYITHQEAAETSISSPWESYT